MLPASNMMLAPRQPPVVPQAEDDLRCEYRGERLGTINCGCQGAPDAYVCSNENVASSLCILHARAYRRKEILLADGGRRAFEGKPGVCAVCRHRRNHPHHRELRPEDLEW